MRARAGVLCSIWLALTDEACSTNLRALPPLCRHCSPGFPSGCTCFCGTFTARQGAAVAAAAFIGHLFPVFHGFKGGKGVATALGILLAIDWVLGLTTLSTWLIVAVFLRYSSLAALVSAVFAPIYFIFLFGVQPMAIAIAVMSTLLIWRHKANIQKLLRGEEGRIGSKK